MNKAAAFEHITPDTVKKSKHEAIGATILLAFQWAL